MCAWSIAEVGTSDTRQKIQPGICSVLTLASGSIEPSGSWEKRANGRVKYFPRSFEFYLHVRMKQLT